MSPAPTQNDSVCVIIPSFNEESNIGRCIASLQRQSFPIEDHNIIVVDNGSQDGTQRIVRESGARLLEERRRSAYRARNKGIRNSTSRWVAFTDADCIAEPDWLENMIGRGEETDAWIVGGLTRYDILRDSIGNRLLSESHQPEQLRRTIEDYHCVAGGNMLVRRTAFEQFGLFRIVKSGSDIELSKRLYHNGHASVFASDAVVHHQCDLTDWEYLRRSYRIRYGQRSHSTKPSGPIPALKHFANVPWRPGFRAVSGLAVDRPKGSTTAYLHEWLYRWGTRWAGFLGELHAAAIRPPSHEPSESDKWGATGNGD